MTSLTNSDVVRVAFEEEPRQGQSTPRLIKLRRRTDLIGLTVAATRKLLNEEADQDHTFSTPAAEPPFFLVGAGGTKKLKINPNSRLRLGPGDKLIVTVKQP